MKKLKIVAIRMTDSNKHVVVSLNHEVGFGYSQVALAYYPTSQTVEKGEEFEYTGNYSLREMHDKDGNLIVTKTGQPKCELCLN